MLDSIVEVIYAIYRSPLTLVYIGFQLIVFICLSWVRTRHWQRLTKPSPTRDFFQQDQYFIFLSNRALPISSPAGEVFLTLGILGTFIGLAVTLANAKDLSLFSAVLSSAAEVDVNKLLGPVCPELQSDSKTPVVDCQRRYIAEVSSSGVLALVSSIFGIFFSISARLFWPPTSLDAVSSDEISTLCARLCNEIDQGAFEISGRDNFGMNRISKFLSILAKRSDVTDLRYHELVTAYTTSVAKAVDVKHEDFLKQEIDEDGQINQPMHINLFELRRLVEVFKNMRPDPRIV
ncbi:MAG: hypothetical protein AAF393_07215 [Pseudomonadota bacterium]